MSFPPLLDVCLPILDFLTVRTRVASFEHLVRFEELYPGSAFPVAAILNSLEQRGYLTSQLLTVRLIAYEKAVFIWEPGAAPPDVRVLANLLAARNCAAPWTLTKLYWATRKAAALTGGLSGVNRQPLQVQHDLGTTAAYLHLSAHDAPLACTWFSEDILLRDFRPVMPRKRPDAAVFDGDGIPLRLIEIGGVYSAHDLRRIHRHYSRLGVRYDLF